MTDAHDLTVAGIPGIIRLEGFPGDLLPSLAGLNVNVVAGDVRREADYVVRVAGVRPSRAGTPPQGSPPRRFTRHQRVEGGDRMVLRGGTVTFMPGRREARVILRGTSSGSNTSWQAEAVLTTLQHALALQGWATLHAAAFEIGNLGVLAVGPTCAGKSTLSMAVLASGGRVVSDDWLAAGHSGMEGPGEVLPLRRDIWLRDGSTRILAGVSLGPAAGVGSRGEHRWRLPREEKPECFVDRVRTAVILRLRRDRRLRGYRLRRITAAEGLSQLFLVSSPLFISSRYPEERARLLPTFNGLVNNAVCFDLRLGTDLVTQPAATVRRVLADLGAG